MENKLQNYLHYLNFFAAILLAASLILWVPMQRPALYLFFITYIVEIFVDAKWKNIKFGKNTYWIGAIMLIFLLALFYMPFENTNNYFLKVIERRLPLFAFAIIALFGFNKLYKLSCFLNTFIITSVIAILYLIFVRIGISEFFSNQMSFEFFNLARNNWVSTHMIFNFYLNISLISGWFILSTTWDQLSWFNRLLYLLSMLMMVIVIAISEGRSGFILCLFLVFGFILYEIWKRRKIMGVILALLVPFIIIIAASQKERFTNHSLKNESRLVFWHAAYNTIKEKPLTGYGVSDAQNKYEEQRTKIQPPEYVYYTNSIKQIDAHNQYLQTTMEFGVLGLALLLFIYVYPLFIVDKDRKLMTYFIVFACMFQSVFDMFITNVFSVFYCLLMLLMLFVKNDISGNAILENNNSEK